MFKAIVIITQRNSCNNVWHMDKWNNNIDVTREKRKDLIILNSMYPALYVKQHNVFFKGRFWLEKNIYILISGQQLKFKNRYNWYTNRYTKIKDKWNHNMLS